MQKIIKIFSIFFLILYTSFALRIVIPFIDYSINYTFITEELCEEKDNLVNECHGKCHLAKEIKKQVDPQNENGEKIVIIDFVKVPHLISTDKNQYIKNPIEIKFVHLSLKHLDFRYEPLTPPPKVV
ncbi:MAG: hypothetical protein V3V16_00330 [Melioribacteraceae bacterium]